MAYACRKYSIPLTVFAAETANPFKLARIQQLGAEVKRVGKDFDAAKQAGKAYALAEKLIYVEDGREPEIAIGAGTIGLELSHYAQPDAILVPLGNGALINGIGTWFKAHHPATQIIGVTAAGAPAMDLSWRCGRLVTAESVDTIADGIAVRVPIAEALDVMKTVVDDVVQVSDQAILQAMKLVHELVGIVLEPAGAVGLAAAMVDKNRFTSQRIATPLCGSNLTEAQLTQWL
jgi:threonine dehydratase